MTNAFIQALKQKPILADGAIGTLLYARGASPEASFEQLNLSNRDLVQQVHVDYLNAGSEVITTNSFSGNRFKLENFGLEKEVWNINLWSAKIARNAREIAGKEAFVAGSIGPTGKLLPPVGDTKIDDLEAAFKHQMEGLLAGGVDLFLIETMSSIDELMAAVRAARSLSKLPVVAQLSFAPEGHTLMGSAPEDMVRLLDELGDDLPEVIGINCGAGPGPVFDSLLRMSAAFAKRNAFQKIVGYSAVPNAGQPSLSGGRYMFMSRPDYCASYVDPLIRAGARLIGGCCGTTPAHIKAMRETLDAYITASKRKASDSTLQDLPSQKTSIEIVVPKQASPALKDAASTFKEDQGAELPESNKPTLAERLMTLKKDSKKGFFVSVELDPPKGAITQKLVKAATALKDAGADSINVGDSPMARVRMSSLATCQIIGQKVGIETIIHFTTRDRNLMGIQADLLGCQALGVNNILALTGDPPNLGNYAHATAVYDVDSIGLIRVIKQLNEGKDIGDNTIGTPTKLSIGCALNLVYDDQKDEVGRFRKKLEAGAHFVMTQPIYQVEDLTRFLDEFGDVNLPILVGIMPLHSSKHAEYLHNEVPGITIPEHIREAMAKAGVDGSKVGLELAEELLEKLRSICQGTYLVPSFGRYDDMCSLIERLKKTVLVR